MPIKNVRFRAGAVNIVHRLTHFMQRDITAADDVRNDAFGAVNRNIFQKRIFDGELCRFRSARSEPARFANAHQRFSRASHHRADVGKIHINFARVRNDVRDRLDGLSQNIIGDAESVFKSRGRLNDG